jgi:SAM-dependent methyltransferase
MSKDLFSGHASQYAAFRPTYPAELYEFLYSHVSSFENAWDAGTGNGQVARVLARRFKNVFATDISKRQLENAVIAENIFYWQTGEQTTFSEKYFDLICVAQAIHWFDREKFYAEVKRVAKPTALIAVWGYGLLSINKEIDELLQDFYTRTIGSYWDKDRRLIDQQYKTISFPFRELECPAFSIHTEWNLQELHGYLTTWSSVQKFIEMHEVNSVDELISRIQPHWKIDKQPISFPIFMRVGKVNH